MLKILVDESSGRKLFQYLLDNNYDAKFVSDIFPGAPDIVVLDMAEKEKRILITNDKDFGELVFKLKKPSSGVILLRLIIDNPILRQKYISYVLKTLPDKLRSHFIVVRESQIRMRKLDGI